MGRRSSAWFFAAPLVAFTASAASAQDSGRQPCRHHDESIDRCDPAQAGRVAELHGWPRIEQHLAAGDQVRRMFIADDRDEEVLAISFVRTAAQSPTVEVRVAPRESEPWREPLTATVEQTAWNEIIDRSRLFHRRLSPEPNPSGLITVCPHAWYYTVESVDPVVRNQTESHLRRQGEDSCGDGLTESYALELARTAASVLAPCAALSADPHGGYFDRVLLDCARFTGDRIAAAEAMNEHHGPRREYQLGVIRGSMASSVAVDWNGERVTGRRRVSQLWDDRISEDHNVSFRVVRVHGEISGRVRLEGILTVSRWQGEELHIEEAPVEQIWVRDWRFMVQNITIGPYRPWSGER